MKISGYEHHQQNEIQHLFTEVFTASEGVEEGESIGRLALDMMRTTKPNDIFGFIATEQEAIIASIFFTRLSFDTTDNVFILSPVAVHTQYQGQGVGQKLINYGLAQIKQQDIALVFTYGDPAFYSRVGFAQTTQSLFAAPHKLSQPEGWLYQSLGEPQIRSISGPSRCVNALNNPDFW